METSRARITGKGYPWNGPLNLIQQDVFVKHMQFTKIQVCCTHMHRHIEINNNTPPISHLGGIKMEVK